MTVTPWGTAPPPALDDARGVMFDIDGCLMLSDKPGGESGRPLDGAAEMIDALRAADVPFVVFTNGSSRAPAAIAAELRDSGLDVQDGDVLTPAVVAVRTLRERHPGGRVLAFGGDGVTAPLRDAGIDLVDVDEALVVGPRDVAAVVIGWDTEFGQPKIQAAAEALRDGAALYCTSSARAFASHGRLNVGVSGFVAAGLEHVSGVRSVLVGKPSSEAMAQVAAALDLPADEIIVVGDDLTLECAMARENGALSALVTTGMAGREEAAATFPDVAPHWIVDSMYDFAELIAPVLRRREANTSRR